MDLHKIFTHTIASRAMRKNILKILVNFKIICGKFEILYLLQGSEGLNPSEITYTLNYQPAATSRIVNSLNQRGLVEYNHDQDDRRQVSINLSEQGKFLIETIKETIS